ncbi:DNA repair protein RecO [Streptococcus sciuri]|uniref:DNA repair protein RecO n=1 Tax=Streptococcus sciuri TaxID=2973939 RepID=A0ABT2FA92_9STRE|nr:DNA repair protein RecO [Streptococcus sciuri]MCS4488951.1 DNA repair protein RecO [Streptococcus sciuri]
MDVRETKGLILFNRDYREDDKLVKIFTEMSGKRMFFVKHASRSALNPVIQPLVVADFILRINDNGLSYIVDYKKVTHYSKITADLFRLAYASYILALADAAIEDNVQDPNLFVFLKKVLDLMEEGLDYEILTNIFEVQILDRFGVLLNFHNCCVCHRAGLPFDFSYRYSGVLCPKHYDRDEHRTHIDSNVLYLLDCFQQVPIDDVRTISLKPEMKAKIRQFLDSLYDDYVGIHLKSKKFIDDLETWGDIMKTQRD